MVGSFGLSDTNIALNEALFRIQFSPTKVASNHASVVRNPTYDAEMDYYDKYGEPDYVRNLAAHASPCKRYEMA